MRSLPRVLVVLACVGGIAPSILASTAPAAPPSVRGTVTDSSSIPVPSARVTVAPLNRTTTTDEAGRFVIRNLPPGTYHVSITRIGFAPAHADVVVPLSGPDVTVAVKMHPSALELSGVQITATPAATDTRDVAQAVTDLSTAALSRDLSSSIAQTLSAEPGLSVRFNGPAATAPVIRGLQGDRVLVLQDGNRTGDLASSAPDHSVSVDPLTAERVEVVRGPASLLYGNQALGGVVNVISNDIPTAIPSHLEGSFASQFESVTPGASGTVGITVPVGENFAIVGRGGGRHADNLRMGGGDQLANSFFRNYYGLGGVAFAGANADGGVIFRYYHQNYGLPSGVGERSRIDGARKEVESRSDVTLTNGYLTSLKISGTAQWYQHSEINEETGTVNTAFDLKTQTIDLLGRTKLGPVSGALGLSGIRKQYASTGEEALTPAANSNGAGAFLYEEIPLGPTHGSADALVPKLQLGGRYDLYAIDSKAGDAKFGPARSLDFNTFSGSAGLTIPLNAVVSLSGSYARAFRAPTVEELFSNAFHGALGTFDVGNPNLKAEINQGGEIILHAQSSRVNAQFAAYRNTIEHFITPSIVKDTTIEADGGASTVPLNRIAQANALMYGAEGRVEVEVVAHLVVGGLGDLVHGEFAETKVPLSYIPPARVGALARWDDGVRSFNVEGRHAFQQDRVPPPVSNDDPAGVATDAYNLVNLSAGYVFNVRGQANSITFRVDNVLDEKYRDATSRIKLFAFNPGRNFALTYKVLF
jgi:iron complex outermembrane receptor protein